MEIILCEDIQLECQILFTILSSYKHIKLREDVFCRNTMLQLQIKEIVRAQTLLISPIFTLNISASVTEWFRFEY